MTRKPRSWASRRKCLEVLQRAVGRMDARVIGDVVAVVSQRRGIKGQQPERGDAEVLQVIEFFGKPRKSPMPSPLPSQKARTCTS